MQQCVLPGIAHDSPLFKAIGSALGTDIALRCQGPVIPSPVLWQYIVTGTKLDWRGTATPDPGPEPRPGEIVIDLFQASVALPAQARRWWFANERGEPVLAPFVWAKSFYNAPYYFSLLLLADSPDGAVVLGEAHLTSRRSLAELLSTVAETCAALLADAFRHPSQERRLYRSQDSIRPRGAIGAVCHLLRGAVNRCYARWRDRLLAEDWAIGQGSASLTDLVTKSHAPHSVDASVLGPISWQSADSPRCYLADPFFWPGLPDRRLAEEFSYETGLGRIVTLDATQGGACELDLGFDCHLSYPFTWSEGGDVFMIPESGASRITRLFRLRLDREPEVVCTIAEDMAIADPTLFRYEGLYWIAFTNADLGVHDNLCLLFSETLSGPWRVHPGNPVKRDVRSARPGGTPFWQQGELYRPAQDCAAGYGAALAINRIIRCDPAGYHEETCLVIRPDPSGPYPDGLHTLSFREDGGAFLIDGKRYRTNGAALMKKVKSRLLPP